MSSNVLLNPTKEQFNNLMSQTTMLGGFYTNSTLYVWNEDITNHNEVEQEYSLNQKVILSLYFLPNAIYYSMPILYVSSDEDLYSILNLLQDTYYDNVEYKNIGSRELNYDFVYLNSKNPTVVPIQHEDESEPEGVEQVEQPENINETDESEE